MKRAAISILAATLWISVSEFVRNSLLLREKWVELYQSHQMVFPESPMNGAVWGLWSLGFAVVMYMLARKFTLVETTLLGWFMAFVLMWLALGNLDFLPFAILPLAIPLSLLEAFGAALICKRIAAH